MKTHSLPDNLQTLNAATKVYNFTVHTGEIVGDPTGTDETINFFIKDDKRREHDFTLQTSVKARQGHCVSIISASKNKDEFTHVIAWVNHTTEKVDYLKKNARKVVGDKIPMFFLTTSEATINAVNGLMDRHSGVVNIFILPIMLCFFVFSLFCLIIGSLFGLKSEKSVSAILKQASQIIESFDPTYAVYSSKPSKFIKIVKWAGIAILAFLALTFIFFSS